ncbi:MAG: peptide transporter, partial [Lentisphaerae bacterium]
IQIFEIPFTDLTPTTGQYLKAVATGINWNLYQVVIGMVLPFWAMVGSFVGLLITMVLNPILYHFEVLHSWIPGDGTVATLFKNNVDFYFSFTIGVSAAVCIAGFWQVFAGLRKKREKNLKMQGIRLEQEDTSVPEGRGDIPFSLGITVYLALTTFVIILSGYLIDWHPGVMIVLFILGYFYTPLISYVTARLEGMAGQVVQVPMIREICLILSGYQGVAIWFLPMPLGNYGQMTMFYRRCELLGTKFTSVWKAMVFLYPIILISSILFANFIWHIAEVPSAMYPYAQVMWPLNAEMQSIMFSATMGEYSQFEEALNFAYIGWGTFFGVGLFAILSYLGAPIFLVYGVVRGLGQTLPHAVLGQFFGALLGHFYFRKQFGKMWRKYIPVIGAGFACGMGLINVFGIGIVFLNKSVVQLLY